MLALKFLYSVIANDDQGMLFKVKEEFFRGPEKQYVDFTQDFYANFKKLPDIQTVEHKFGIQLLQNNESTQHWFNELFASYKNHVIDTAVISSAKDKTKAIEIFQNAIVEYNIDIGGKVESYADTTDRLKNYKLKKINKGLLTYLQEMMILISFQQVTENPTYGHWEGMKEQGRLGDYYTMQLG